MLVGAVLLVLTLAYADLLRRYGAGSVVQSAVELVDWTTARIGAFPRPLVVLLGIPALVWGTHMRARRRQGWWVCAFGVTATIPLARACSSPAAASSRRGCRRRTPSSWACCWATSWCASTSRSPARAGVADAARRRPRRTAPSRRASPSSDYAPVTASVAPMARSQSTEILAEMVANVLVVSCEVGDTIAQGDTVILLESMKMEIPVLAERAGTVTAIKVTAGDVVQEGDPLVVLD